MATSQPAGPEALTRARLERALAQNEFALFCQPIRDLRRGGYPMAELLVRMRDEESALVPPGEFLPVFEELGLMPALDRWVVSHAARCLRHGSRIPTLTVNLSGQTLADATFAAFVAKELRATGVAPGSLVFEIDEADLIAGLEHAASIAAALQGVGCGAVIDSFGCTPHSLTHLKRLRVDAVKLDGAIVRRILLDGVERKLVDSVLRIATAVELEVIGACVEDQAVLLRLKALDFGYAQGFGIHQPGPLEKIVG